MKHTYRVVELVHLANLRRITFSRRDCPSLRGAASFQIKRNCLRTDFFAGSDQCCVQCFGFGMFYSRWIITSMLSLCRSVYFDDQISNELVTRTKTECVPIPEESAASIYIRSIQMIPSGFWRTIVAKKKSTDA